MMDAAMDSSEKVFWRIEVEEGVKALKKFVAGRREELQTCRESMSESLGHRLRQPDERGKKRRRWEMKRVIHPVPEQQLRFSLTRVQSPYGHNNTQHNWSSFTPEGKNHTLDTSPGLPSQPKGNSTLDPTRSSFTTEGKQHPGSHQVFLHNRRETTPWIPPGLPSHTKGNTTKRIE
ncbi:hypothetical protein Taro_000625 [Colocasia esculenta]|uniref:Uncharacterized protein n=1 Tax=Colocasia esculenta TaxID=4460 RepID=A0A843TCN5_COLES|nr:hypothetical protein [Colocasia esculenta]